MTLQTSSKIIQPDLSGIKDQATKDVFDQLLRFLYKNQNNVFDDLTNILNQSETEGVIYFGDPATEGTWRIIVSGNNLNFERLESSVWVEKNSILP